MSLKKALIVALALGALGLGGYRLATGRCPLTGKCLHCREDSTQLTDQPGSGSSPAPSALAEETGSAGTRGGRAEQPAAPGTAGIAAASPGSSGVK